MTEPVPVRLKWLPHGEGLPLPFAQTAQSAGVDLCAALDANNVLTLKPGMRSLVPAGFAMALPPGYEAQIRPRSGLAMKHGVTILNAPGTIDADYRGEIQVIVINLGQESVEIKRGDRIAQMVIAPVVQPAFIVGEDLDATQRGTGGFGSTGRS